MNSTIAMTEPRAAVAADVFSLWIDGRERPAKSGKTFERVNPFDGSIAARFANGGESDAWEAIAAARKAFDAGFWPRSTALARFQILMRAAQILASNASVLAWRMVLESC